VTELDLGRPRELGEILGDTLRVFRQHAGVFLSLSLALVAPVVLLVDGVWGRALVDGTDAKAPVGSFLVSLLLSSFVLPTLATALVVRVVQAIAQGRTPSVGEAFREAAPSFAPALAVVAMAAIPIAAASLLIIPGIWLALRWYFAAQVVVVEGLRGTAALRRSVELGRGGLWRVLGVLLTVGIVFGLLALLVQLPFGAAGPWLYVAGMAVGQGVALSLIAVAGTLLYFDLRARLGQPWAPVVRSLDSPA
jgi:hypothetical protein